MKQRFKKLVSSLLTVIMVFGVLTVAQFTVNAANTADSLVAIAEGELGNTNYSKYYGGNAGAWCADFVTWCAQQAGVSSITNSSSCYYMYTGMTEDNHCQEVSSPQIGDIVFFYCNSCSGTANKWCHVGIMVNSTTSIDGNYGGKVSYDSIYSHYGSLGYKHSSGISKIYVRPNYSNPTPPQNPVLNIPKYVYGLDENIELSFSAEGQVDYTACQIWCDDILVYSQETQDNTLIIPCSQLGAGKYATYVSFVNSYGNVISSTVEFYIAERLSNPQISINGNHFDLYDAITFTVSADGAPDYYGLQIWKADTVVYGETFTGHIINVPCEKLGRGDYGAFISCVNASGSISTEVVHFRIGDEPTNPEITLNGVNFGMNDILTFTVSADGAPDYYGLQIWKADTVVYGETFTGHTINVPCEVLGVGNYAAFVSCVNDLGSVNTDLVRFRIQEKKIFVQGDANCDGTINLLDAVLAQKATLKLLTLDEQGIANADMNGDGKITLFDSIAIQKLALSVN